MTFLRNAKEAFVVLTSSFYGLVLSSFAQSMQQSHDSAPCALIKLKPIKNLCLAGGSG